MAAEKELEELTKKAVEHCMVFMCGECPFKGSPSRCVAVLQYVTHVLDQRGNEPADAGYEGEA